MGLDTVELVLEVEKHFDVSIPDERAEKTATVEALARLLYELLTHREIHLSYNEIIFQLQQIINRMFQIPIERITPEARFIDDLGLN